MLRSNFLIVYFIFTDNIDKVLKKKHSYKITLTQTQKKYNSGSLVEKFRIKTNYRKVYIYMIFSHFVYNTNRIFFPFLKLANSYLFVLLY